VIFADIGQYFKLFSLGMPAGFQARVGKHLFDRIRRQVPKKIYFIYFIGGIFYLVTPDMIPIG